MSTLTSKAIVEVQRLTKRAEELAQKGKSTEANALLSQAATIRATGLSTEEMRIQYTDALIEETRGVQESPEQIHLRHGAAFGRYIAGKMDETSFDFNENAYRRELRAIADSGSAPASQLFTDGPNGGFFVPQGFDAQIRDAEVQSSGGLLSPDYISIIDEPTFGLPAKTVQGFDLTTVTASSTAESTQQIDTPNLATVAPAYSAPIQNNNLYRVALAVSLEAEEDIQAFQARIARVVGVAMARKQGADVVTTLKNALSSSYTTQNSGYVTLDDLQQIVFGVDRLYRQGKPDVLAPVGHCCWVMNDSVWQRINRSGSGQSSTAKGVPYLDVRSCPGIEYLCGYPVVITPDLNGLSSSPVVNGDIFFGDLSKLILRRGKMFCIRSFQSKGVGGVDYGQATIRCTQRAGSVFFDAGSSAAPAVVRATVTV